MAVSTDAERASGKAGCSTAGEADRVKEGLRRRFEEHEKGFFALDGHENYFEELDALFDKQERETAAHVDRAQGAWDRMQREKEIAAREQDHGIERERER
jgi:hypothetical protein